MPSTPDRRFLGRLMPIFVADSRSTASRGRLGLSLGLSVRLTARQIAGRRKNSPPSENKHKARQGTRQKEEVHLA
jgi:hypothetical protein